MEKWDSENFWEGILRKVEYKIPHFLKVCLFTPETHWHVLLHWFGYIFSIFENHSIWYSVKWHGQFLCANVWGRMEPKSVLFPFFGGLVIGVRFSVFLFSTVPTVSLKERVRFVPINFSQGFLPLSYEKSPSVYKFPSKHVLTFSANSKALNKTQIILFPNSYKRQQDWAIHR